MPTAVTLYDELYCAALTEMKSHDFSSNEATAAMKNLKTLSECHPPTPEPAPDPTPEPTTILEKIKSNLGGVWDNETTRVFIKAGGAFAGVALVTWTTVHRDHVVTREALSQANQRNS
jgi:hypothetical protein